ncbi:hypothetical protein ACFQJ7_09070 [Halovenus rubra]|uniref:Uncharacterized protein n=2 Tax=Halovenus rubra TaxID=869890 RepID=A0ABD5X9C1_9EURY|nr:hypothetical protein [Halovenus rubra]
MSGDGIDVGRLARTMVLIMFVTAVFILLGAERLSGTVFRVGIGAIGAVAFITAITSFLIAAGQYYDKGNPT